MPITGSDDWKQLAEAARNEYDSEKLRQLADQLNRQLKERAENLRPQSPKDSD
jgi:hypothetical protein